MDTNFLEFFLPNGILEWFIIKNIEKDDKKIRIILEEKNIVPEIPKEYKDRKITSKGFTRLFIDDFPIRGRKGELLFLRRSWKINGVNERLKRDIRLTTDGTKLEKEFADFLKELNRF